MLAYITLGSYQLPCLKITNWNDGAHVAKFIVREEHEYE
jgi:hypothetical protein